MDPPRLRRERAGRRLARRPTQGGAEEYLHRAEAMEKASAMIKAEGPHVIQLRESEYHVAAAKFEIARIKREVAGH